MDRLLTPNEQPNIPQDAFSIYDWKTALQIESYINEVKKLQDSKTASLVAQEIRQQIHYSHQAFTDKYDYEGLDPEVYKFVSGLFSQLEQAIKSKWGIE